MASLLRLQQCVEQRGIFVIASVLVYYELGSLCSVLFSADYFFCPNFGNEKVGTGRIIFAFKNLTAAHVQDGMGMGSAFRILRNQWPSTSTGGTKFPLGKKTCLISIRADSRT